MVSFVLLADVLLFAAVLLCVGSALSLVFFAVLLATERVLEVDALECSDSPAELSVFVFLLVGVFSELRTVAFLAGVTCVDGSVADFLLIPISLN